MVRQHRLFVRYAYPASALLSVTGIAVAWVASRPLGGVLYFIPLSAVVLVAAFAGRAPGILAVAISGVGMWLLNFSLGPSSVWRDVAERNQFLAFGVVALLMTLSASRVQHARRAAEIERENARRHSARCEMLASLTLDLAAGTGLEHLLSTAVPRTADLLGADDASLFLVEEGGTVLVGAFEVQPKERTGARLPVAECPHVRAAVASGRPRLFRRADTRGVERAWMERLAIDGALATPLAAHGQTVGVLFVSYGDPARLGHDDLAFASALASACALAITRAQAFQHERAAREAADRALEQLREADRRKDEFLAMLSHELRNPLTPIRNSLYLLQRAGPVTERGARAREIIERQVLHLSRLVDDLLDVTRISRGKIQVHRAAVELKKLVARTADDHRGAFEQARVALAVCADGPPAWVHADATRLAQAIGNVLSNAVKFTPEGGHVEVRVEADDENAFVRVRDDGIGIDEAMLPHVFEAFAQADRSLARTRGGLGLGLSLVKGLVELHGGAVSASSDGPGMGAELTVSLPLAPRTERAAPAPARREASGGRRVLIIEDNHDAADALREALETFGHEVQVAYDGVDGLEKAHAATPEVVLCDIGLPSINGYEVARRFRADPELRSSALIALSGYASGDDQRRAAQAGFDLHIAKPPTLERLQEAIASAPVAGPQGVA